jgi:putative sugar O-methyltransferase
LGNIFNSIEKAFKELENKNSLYKPSSFWVQASKKIFNQIKTEGIENFRGLSLSLRYFVPTYSSPGNSLNKDIEEKIWLCLNDYGVNKKQFATIQNFLSGYNYANSDYRVFVASDDSSKKPFLDNFSENSYGNPREQFDFAGKMFSRSALNYMLGLVFLKKNVGEVDIRKVLEIGGGFGTLGEILNTSGIANMKYINIDIPPICYIAWNYLSKIYKDEINPLESMLENDLLTIEELKPCSVFNNWQIEQLKGEIDLFVNYISFQEMEPDIVMNYINHVKRLNAKFILLCNIREGKQKKIKHNDVGVKKPILKGDYIKMIGDSYELVGTNVVPFGFKTVDGFHSELMLFHKK